MTLEEDLHYAARKPLFSVEGLTLEPGSVIVGWGVARVGQSGPGEYMTFRAHDGKMLSLKIQGVLDADSELVSSDLMLIAETDFRRVFGVPEVLVTDAVVSVTNPEEVATVSTKISKQFPDSRPIVRDEIRRTYDPIKAAPISPLAAQGSRRDHARASAAWFTAGKRPAAQARFDPFVSANDNEYQQEAGGGNHHVCEVGAIECRLRVAVWLHDHVS